jgi:hypothetical protein
MLSVSRPRDKTPAGSVLLSRSVTFHQVRLQLAPDLGSSIDAHANQPGPARRNVPDGRDSDLFSLAVGDDGFLAHVEEYGAAHADTPLFAAAMASIGLV